MIYKFIVSFIYLVEKRIDVSKALTELHTLGLYVT